MQMIVSDAQEWTGQCTTGKHQSPIEISTNETVPIPMPPFIFEFYANPPKAESLTNNGHSVTFTLKAEREITFPKVILHYIQISLSQFFGFGMLSLSVSVSVKMSVLVQM
jgi:carbonic anhydrase